MSKILQPDANLTRSVMRQRRLADAMSHEIVAPPEQSSLEFIDVDVEFSDLEGDTIYTVFNYKNPMTGAHWSIAVRQDGKLVKVLE